VLNGDSSGVKSDGGGDDDGGEGGACPPAKQAKGKC